MIKKEFEYKVEESKDGYKILKVNIDNKWIYIGSKYNMEQEIEKFLYKFTEKKKESVFIVFGFGCGEHIKKLRKKYPENQILVYEPNVSLKEFVNNLEWIKKDDCLAIIYNDTIELKKHMYYMVQEYNLNLMINVSFANYEKIYPLEFIEFLNEVKQNVLSTIMSKNTKMKYSNVWFKTLMNNLPYMANGFPADVYKNKYINKPAVIVSAGPSLEKNICQLKRINDDMIIISSQRTLRPLIENGIKPHLLAAIDPVDVSYEQCKDYLNKVNIPLLLYPGTNDKIVSNHNGMKLFYGDNSFLPKILNREIEIIESGGSVAHPMISYAQMLGCNPIILIGQDCAYTGEKYHANIADNKYGASRFVDVKNDSDIYVEDINGEMVRTSLVLNDYRRGIEQILMTYPDRTYINATEGGARIKGTIEMTLREAIDMYSGRSFKKFQPIKININIKGNTIKYLIEAKKACNEIIEECKNINQGLTQLQMAYKLNNQGKVNMLLEKLDKSDKKIKKKYENIELLNMLLYPIILETLMTADTDIKNEDKIISKNNKLYEEIAKQLEYSLEIIDETLRKIQQ